MAELEETSTEAPRINYSDAQVQAMCTYVKAHYGKLFPNNDKPNTKGRLADAWEVAAQNLMSAGLPMSAKKKALGQHLRDLWHKMVSRAKKYRDDRSATGGGPRPRFHQRHEMVLECLPGPVRKGFVGVEAEGGNVLALLTQIGGQEEDVTHLEEQTNHQQHQQPTVQQQQQQRQEQRQTQPQEQQQTQKNQRNPDKGRKIEGLNHQQQLLEVEREKLEIEKQRLELEQEKVLLLEDILGVLEKKFLSSHEA